MPPLHVKRRSNGTLLLFLCMCGQTRWGGGDQVGSETQKSRKQDVTLVLKCLRTFIKREQTGWDFLFFLFSGQKKTDRKVASRSKDFCGLKRDASIT